MPLDIRPVNTAGSPIGHSGGDPVEVTVTNSVAQSGTSNGRPLVFYYDPAGFTFPVFPETEFQARAGQYGAQHVQLRDETTGSELGVNSSPLRIAGYRGTKTNRSGSTSGSAGTSTQVMAANTSRRSLFFQNVSDTTLWIRFGASATQDQPSIKLLPNSVYWEEGLDVDTDSVHVVCSASSKSYTAYEK